MEVYLQNAEWDSEQLGVKCAAIICENEKKTVAQGTLTDRIAKLVNTDVDVKFICLKLPSEAKAILNDLIKLGFEYIETEFVFRFSNGAPLNYDHEVLFTEKTDSDMFQPMAEDMEHSRFYQDPRIGKERAERIWRESLSNHCNGLNDMLAIAYYDGAAAGLASLRYTSPGSVTIDIFGVLRQYHGEGVGGSLIKAVVNEFARRRQMDVYVEALAGNGRAIELYQRHGFIIDSVKHVLHFWRSGGKESPAS